MKEKEYIKICANKIQIHFRDENLIAPIDLIERTERVVYLQKSLFPDEEINTRELFLIIATNQYIMRDVVPIYCGETGRWTGKMFKGLPLDMRGSDEVNHKNIEEYYKDHEQYLKLNKELIEFTKRRKERKVVGRC